MGQVVGQVKERQGKLEGGEKVKGLTLGGIKHETLLLLCGATATERGIIMTKDICIYASMHCDT